MDELTPRKLSTSAIARQVEIPVQQLFATLKDYGWIRKLEEGWALTTKGEFEGGEYVHSKRYGRYIVWPPQIITHPLFRALEDNRHLSAAQLGRPYQLSARLTNRVLAELGWIHRVPQGWEPTAVGLRQGGVVVENESAALSYVVWPQTAEREPVLTEQLEYCGRLFGTPVTAERDFFTASESLVAADGHHHQSRLALQVCHWLYLAGIAHAVQRRLLGEERLFADFYLPAHGVFIECWDDSGVGLAARMQRREAYRLAEFAVVDIEPSDSEELDEVMTRELRKLGVTVF